ncbi:unnamed protein product, partial [Mesorhabditis spiculigera]
MNWRKIFCLTARQNSKGGNSTADRSCPMETARKASHSAVPVVLYNAKGVTLPPKSPAECHEEAVSISPSHTPVLLSPEVDRRRQAVYPRGHSTPLMRSFVHLAKIDESTICLPCGTHPEQHNESTFDLSAAIERAAKKIRENSSARGSEKSDATAPPNSPSDCYTDTDTLSASHSPALHSPDASHRRSVPNGHSTPLRNSYVHLPKIDESAICASSTNRDRLEHHDVSFDLSSAIDQAANKIRDESRPEYYHVF